jgi:transcriptional regulator with XRE-family HTH domain
MTFGERLLYRRLELGLTREAVAGAAKTTHQSIWRYEKDLKSPDAKTIVRLAKALKCSVGSLFGEGMEHEPTVEEALEAVRTLYVRGKLDLEDVANVIVASKKETKNRIRAK